MKRGEKSGEEGPAEKQENLGEKLRRVGKRGGHTTPTLPPWRLQQLQVVLLAASSRAQDDSITELVTPGPAFHCPTVSARKLAAALWELHHYDLPLSKMHPGVTVPPPPRLRRLHHHQHHLYKDKGLEFPDDPSPSSPDRPESASSLRRHVTASLLQHHGLIERNNHAIQPVSPASYGSSMEVAPYHPAATPTSSIDFKGRIGETNYSLKTSTELLKVLNRIWSLEEQHASNISLVKALKKELDYARARIKELVRVRQSDKHEIDELMRQFAEDKVVRKGKEQDRINAAVQSVRDELEDERKLRKRSESLHRKLARELYEVKTSLANSLKDLEKERKSRKLLEDLCDEFAWGIRDYELEVHDLKQKSDKDWADTADRDKLILHISESWLDERMQMKLEPPYGLGEKSSIVDKLSSEIATFLQAKHNNNCKNNDNLVARNPNLRRNSLESIPLNMAVSAPRDEGDEEDSASSDSHCFELKKPSASDLKQQGDDAESHINEMAKPNHARKNSASNERTKGRIPTRLPVKFEEQMAEAVSHNASKNQAEEQGKTGEGNPIEISISKKSEICEATEEGNSEGKNKADGNSGSKSNYIIDNLIRSHYLLSESGNVPPENERGIASCGNSAWRSHPSPVRQWTSRLPSQDVDISESSSKLPLDLKENTLKAKLLEARTRGQRSRSRLKASKISI